MWCEISVITKALLVTPLQKWVSPEKISSVQNVQVGCLVTLYHYSSPHTVLNINVFVTCGDTNAAIFGIYVFDVRYI